MRGCGDSSDSTAGLGLSDGQGMAGDDGLPLAANYAVVGRYGQRTAGTRAFANDAVAGLGGSRSQSERRDSGAERSEPRMSLVGWVHRRLLSTGVATAPK